ncbi:MAG: hypothetical protein ACE5K7_01900 [Phycisphaerae bacterium]
MSRLEWIFGRRAGLVGLSGLLLALVACKDGSSYLRLRSYKSGLEGRTYFARFDRGYYCTDAQGNWQMVLTAVRPARQDPSQQIEQVLHVRIFWKAAPGQTFAEPTMTNAVLEYYIVCGATAVRYSGAGFVSFRLNRRQDRLSGRIESGLLRAAQVVGGAAEVLGRCEVSGRFVAVLDRRRCVEVTGRMRRLFGPPAGKRETL